ncbi:MAG: HEAT repeat domain-containing protein [Actinomycetota bacterium]
MAHSLAQMGRAELDILVAVAAGDGHPLQADAIRSLESAGDEPHLQRLKIRALRHPDPAVRKAAAGSAEALGEWERTDLLLRLASDPCRHVRNAAIAGLGSVAPDPRLAPLAWAQVQTEPSIAATEALRTYVHHATRAEVVPRLVRLARAETREGLRIGAVEALEDLGAVPEPTGLGELLEQPPPVTWMLHEAILEAFRRLGITPPELGHLRDVDHLDLVDAVFGFDADARRA